MSSWHSYPSIWNLGHAAVTELLWDDVIVEEKVDGSQFSFGRFGSELKFKSKNMEMTLESEGMFFEGCEKVRAFADKLQDGWTYRGEYLLKPKHNVLAYDRIPKNNIIIFDINPGEEAYFGHEEKKAEAERIGFECVPLLYQGKVEFPDQLKSLLELTSVLGGQKIEGFVIKNYSRFGKDKKALMGKYVSEAFKEIHKKDWKEGNPTSGDIIDRLVLSYKTTARFDKAVIHLKEKGLLTDSPKDIGLLMQEIREDVLKECKEDIIKTLFDWGWPLMARRLGHGLPEWYKSKLFDQQFEAKSE